MRERSGSGVHTTRSWAFELFHRLQGLLWSSTLFASNNGEMIEWIAVLQSSSTTLALLFLFAAAGNINAYFLRIERPATSRAEKVGLRDREKTSVQRLSPESSSAGNTACSFCTKKSSC